MRIITLITLREDLTIDKVETFNTLQLMLDETKVKINYHAALNAIKKDNFYKIGPYQIWETELEKR